MIITAGKRSFQELNNEIRGMLLSEDMIRVEDSKRPKVYRRGTLIMAKPLKYTERPATIWARI